MENNECLRLFRFVKQTCVFEGIKTIVGKSRQGYLGRAIDSA